MSVLGQFMGVTVAPLFLRDIRLNDKGGSGVCNGPAIFMANGHVFRVGRAVVLTVFDSRVGRSFC